MTNTIARKAVLGLGLSAMMTLAACNTVNGAGKDLESAGGAVQGASGKDAKGGKK